MLSVSVRRSVVAGVDGSPQARRAARWAAAEAARREVPLRLVTAFPWVRDHAVGHPGEDANRREVLLGRARDGLVAAAGEAARIAPGVPVEQQVVIGSPIPVLAEEARRAHVLVVGDRGLGRLERVLVGSVAVALAAHGASPVVVVRGDGPEPGQRMPVLVGVNGTETSETALAFAVEAAVAREVPLIAVHTWLDWPLDPVLAAPLGGDAVAEQQRQLLAEQLAGWSAKYPELEVELVVEPGRPARVLLERARRAQLVVVGSRGHTELTGLALGSVGNALVRRAPCPVAVVPPERDH